MKENRFSKLLSKIKEVKPLQLTHEWDARPLIIKKVSLENFLKSFFEDYNVRYHTKTKRGRFICDTNKNRTILDIWVS